MKCNCLNPKQESISEGAREEMGRKVIQFSCCVCGWNAVEVISPPQAAAKPVEGMVPVPFPDGAETA